MHSRCESNNNYNDAMREASVFVRFAFVAVAEAVDDEDNVAYK